jgi:hypothetical protein
MKLATQATSFPTNKLTVGASVAALVGTQASPLVAEIWPTLAPAILAGPAATEFVSALVALLAALFVGWFVPDRAQA